MNPKKSRQTIDNIVYQRSRGYTVSKGDIDGLIEDSSSEINDNAYLYYIKSCSYLDGNQLKEAFLANRKALQLCGDDIGTYQSIQAQFISLAQAMARTARFSPEDLEVGWLYENLKDFACLGIENHVLALRHYMAVGNKRKETKLAGILIDLYPNNPVIEEYRADLSPKRREVRNEKNKDSKKATTVRRLKAS